MVPVDVPSVCRAAESNGGTVHVALTARGLGTSESESLISSSSPITQQ